MVGWGKVLSDNNNQTDDECGKVIAEPRIIDRGMIFVYVPLDRQKLCSSAGVLVGYCCHFVSSSRWYHSHRLDSALCSFLACISI